MRISDWSSDVCSSDLRLASLPHPPRAFVDVGGKEQNLPTSVPDGFAGTLKEAQAWIKASRMVDAAKEFAEALGDAGIADLRHVAFAEEDHTRSEEHTSELQSLMRTSYAVFCLKKKTKHPS